MVWYKGNGAEGRDSTESYAALKGGGLQRAIDGQSLLIKEKKANRTISVCFCSSQTTSYVN